MTISGIGICPSFVYWYSGNQLATEACYRRRHLQSDGDQFATMSNMGHACLYHVVLDPTILLELQTKVRKDFTITEQVPTKGLLPVESAGVPLSCLLTMFRRPPGEGPSGV